MPGENMFSPGFSVRILQPIVKNCLVFQKIPKKIKISFYNEVRLLYNTWVKANTLYRLKSTQIGVLLYE